MFEDNKDFYPTPESVIDKMLEGINFYTVGSILEPSAGKGDLVEGITKAFERVHQSRWGKVPKIDLDCIELQPELQMILKGKGYRVVHDDFLRFNTYKRYEWIISNPPFSQGAKHLLKMIEMQEEHGGGIVCLLNAETLKNPYTSERIVLTQKLAKLNADIVYLENAFTGAERKTDVEVALVKVQVPVKEETSFIFEDTLKKAEDLEYKEKPEQAETYLAENDFIKAIVKQFNVEVGAGIKLLNEFNAMKPHLLKEFTEDGKNSSSILNLGYNDYNRRDDKVTYNGFVEEVRRKYWKALFTNPNFTGMLTSKLRNDYLNKIERLIHYDFSEFNILSLRAEMNTHVVKGVEDAIIDLFDELSHKYAYYDESENIHYFNGWKTNKAWIINKKVIIRLNAFSEWRGQYDYEPTRYDLINKLTDIEKGFNYLDGGLTDNIDLNAILEQAKKDYQTKKIQLKYFTVTFYKKGTCHIEFTNEELLKKFNIFGAQRKGWLPPSYGKKTYTEMAPEEKAVVDEFEGEQAYKETVNNKDYYIVKTENLLLLE